MYRTAYGEPKNEIYFLIFHVTFPCCHIVQFSKSIVETQANDGCMKFLLQITAFELGMFNNLMGTKCNLFLGMSHDLSMTSHCSIFMVSVPKIFNR